MIIVLTIQDTGNNLVIPYKDRRNYVYFLFYHAKSNKKADDKSRPSGRFVPLYKVLCTVAKNVIYQNEKFSGFSIMHRIIFLKTLVNLGRIL